MNCRAKNILLLVGAFILLVCLLKILLVEVAVDSDRLNLLQKQLVSIEEMQVQMQKYQSRKEQIQSKEYDEDIFSVDFFSGITKCFHNYDLELIEFSPPKVYSLISSSEDLLSYSFVIQGAFRNIVAFVYYMETSDVKLSIQTIKFQRKKKYGSKKEYLEVRFVVC